MQDVQISASHNAVEERQPPLPLRNDTILGVCEAVGEDFGFNPNWLRVVFAGAIYLNPAVVIGAYLALGIVVAASRLLFPKRQAALAPEASAQPLAAEEKAEAESLPLAA